MGTHQKVLEAKTKISRKKKKLCNFALEKKISDMIPIA